MRLVKLGSHGELSLTKDLIDEVPRYAILSHTWGRDEDEATFHDLENGSGTSKAGYAKLQFCAKQAKKDGLDYFWLDTCCIDKSSSSELSEAINSMFRWYRNAVKCYVYLSDVSISENASNVQSSSTTRGVAFHKSRWFCRGWTLQEMLAPSVFEFYDGNGQFRGDRISRSSEISQVTGIACQALETGNIRKYSIAQKMSWAANRITTRPEDKAYCLMGLFGVNMPLIYGEGERAFVRLQEEIIKDSDDQSIFAWSMGAIKFSGLLAPGPAFFAGCGHTKSWRSRKGPKPFSMTNRGLFIGFKITPWSADTYLAYLECSGSNNLIIGIFLRRLTEDDQYARINLNSGGLFRDMKYLYHNPDRPTLERELFVRRYVDSEAEEHCLIDRIYGYRLPDSWLPLLDLPRDDGVVELPPGGWGQTKVLDVSAAGKGLKQITLGFDFDFNPVCLLEDSFRDGKDTDLERNNCLDWSSTFPDEFDWHEIHEGSRVYRRRDHDGLWALRGDRLHGLDVLLAKSPMHNTLMASSIVRLQRDETVSPFVWVLSVDNLDGAFAGDADDVSPA